MSDKISVLISHFKKIYPIDIGWYIIIKYDTHHTVIGISTKDGAYILKRINPSDFFSAHTDTLGQISGMPAVIKTKKWETIHTHKGSPYILYKKIDWETLFFKRNQFPPEKLAQFLYVFHKKNQAIVRPQDSKDIRQSYFSKIQLEYIKRNARRIAFDYATHIMVFLKLIKQYEFIPLYETVIHNNPSFENILHSKDSGFSFIDFDTCEIWDLRFDIWALLVYAIFYSTTKKRFQKLLQSLQEQYNLDRATIFYFYKTYLYYKIFLNLSEKDVWYFEANIAFEIGEFLKVLEIWDSYFL